MKILVLGGTGAMGADFVEIAAERGDEVCVTSRSHRETERRNVRFIQGNAQEDAFLDALLERSHYDAIVDFMAYATGTFSRRCKRLLDATDQYVFLSSCRVYAPAEVLTEASPRLLDCCGDAAYLSTDEYALAKARQEDILMGAGGQNWTIVRPYITYGPARLQLGLLEARQWLRRAMAGSPIAFSADIARRETTLTAGRDVAQAIRAVIGRREAMGGVFQITQPVHMRWAQVLEIYCDVLEARTGRRPEVVLEDSAERLAATLDRTYALKYDRGCDRVFDSRRIYALCPELMRAEAPSTGLKRCLEAFLDGGNHGLPADWRYEGYADRIAHIHTPVWSIPGTLNKLRYALARYSRVYDRRKPR